MRIRYEEPKKIITSVIQPNDDTVNSQETPNITDVTTVREQTDYITGTNTEGDVTVNTIKWELEKAEEDIIRRMETNLRVETNQDDTWQERDIALETQYEETNTHTQELINQRELLITQRTNDDAVTNAEIVTELNNVRTNLNNMVSPAGLFDWVGSNYITYGVIGGSLVVVISGIYLMLGRENATNIVAPGVGLGLEGIAGAGVLRSQHINVTVNAQQRTPADAVADVVKNILPKN